MSRNLGQTYCNCCGGDVEHEESPRPVAAAEAGAYFEEYQRRNLIVARAHCIDCRAKYLAWCEVSRLHERDIADPAHGQRHIDLSYRSSFDDEPGDGDLPEVAFAAAIAMRALRKPEDYRYHQGGPRLTADAALEVAEAWMQRAHELRLAETKGGG